ncbi:uncharacterized protein DNG_09531 [Cephalotrichum gorgonifer]|uniref:BRCT domain-containing protein n=1 Tax=Cephalotrichum gorgonifer TaxID=2041049 RepID=A0AAE8N8C2_9PEZI|nr:uncharacterized protein DNG_09531 [Cephalotrichum gorgonifer]
MGEEREIWAGIQSQDEEPLIDSQVLFNRYCAEFGLIGLVAGTPVSSAHVRASQWLLWLGGGDNGSTSLFTFLTWPAGCACQRPTALGGCCIRRETELLDADTHITTTEFEPVQRPRHEPDCCYRARGTLPEHDHEQARRGRKMDATESPTQANDDRDYDSARRHEADIHLDSFDLPDLHDEPHTLLDGDTGAVNFGSLSPDGKMPSQLSDILSPLAEINPTHRGAWRAQKDSQQEMGTTPARLPAPPPETPTPVNPFRTKPQASVLRATQMFNATQFSSAVKGVSPTSSRPSPHTFHNGFMTSTSPAGPMTSPLKNRFALSSPSLFKDPPTPFVQPPPSLLETRSPQPESRTPQPQPQKDDDTAEAIPESPPGDEADLPPPRKRQRQELLEDYEPVAASQERKLFVDPLKSATGDSDSEEDAEFQRRLQAKLIRERAERRLDGISFELPKRGEDGRHSKRLAATQGTPTKNRLGFRQSKRRDLVHEQKSSLPGHRNGRLSNLASSVVVVDDDLPHTQTPEQATPDAEADLPPNPERAGAIEIPETSSPPAVGARQATSPRRKGGEELPSTTSSNLPPARIPQSSPQVRPRPGRAVDATSSRAGIPESPIVVPESDFSRGVPASEDTLDAATQEHTADETRRMRRMDIIIPSSQPLSSSKAEARSRRSSPVLDPVNTSSSAVQTATSPRSVQSSLSALSSTPSPVDSPTPIDTPELAKPPPVPLTDKYDLPDSSAFDHSAPKPTRRPIKTYSRATRKALPRSLRSRDSLDLDSTDELAPAPATAPAPKPPPSRSLRGRESLGRGTPDELTFHPTSPHAKLKTLQSRLGASRAARPGNGRLFQNMSFAISFQERKDDETAEDYEARCSISEELSRLVSGAGGRILVHGFNELLDPATLRDNLYTSGAVGGDSAVEVCPGAESLGFTALLADGHSRKVKYMQALALGLPCLAYQWATASLEKGEVVEWAPYLLCAGQSAPLGDAVLSRSLAPYAAAGAEARFVDVVGRRRLLLGSERILLVMKKVRGEEGKDRDGRMSYLMLARISGANVTRVCNVRDARAALRKGGFGWVYVDGETCSVGQVLGEGGGQSKGKGKRKRGSGGVEGDGGETGKVRCLSNELVVQSLIAGRVIDEEERAAYGL